MDLPQRTITRISQRKLGDDFMHLLDIGERGVTRTHDLPIKSQMTEAVLSNPGPCIIDLRMEGPKLHSVE